MKKWQRMVLFGAVGPLMLLVAAGAEAVSISGRSSTEIEWYEDAGGEKVVPAYEYLQINVTDLDGDGLDFRGYGRVAEDLADEADIDSRLYYAYLEKKGALPGLDFKLGRQFISTTAGASLMDGLTLKYSGIKPLRFTLFGGGDVGYYSGYDAKDLIDGASLVGTFLDDDLEVGISYIQKWEESELTHELAGLNVDYKLSDIDLYAETQYNLLAGAVSYFDGGAIYNSDSWSLRGEYLYSLPIFSATSIYSVFAVDEYQEAQAELSLRHGDGLRSFVQYTHEFYQEVDDADVIEAGVEKIRTDKLSGYLIGVLRADNDGQDLYGIKVRCAYLVIPKLAVGVGAHVDVLERRIEEDDESTSSRVWVDATAYVDKKISLEAKLERAESDLWEEDYRGRVRLNILF